MRKYVFSSMILCFAAASADPEGGRWYGFEKNHEVAGHVAVAILRGEDHEPRMGVTCIRGDITVVAFLENMEIGQEMAVRYRIDDGPLYEEKWEMKRTMDRKGILAGDAENVARRLASGQTLRMEVKSERWSTEYETYSLAGAKEAVSRVLEFCRANNNGAPDGE